MSKYLLWGVLILTLVCAPSGAQTRPSFSSLTTVPTMAGLRALKPTTDGTCALVRGYYTDSDGGGGIFYYDADTTDTDDSGTLIRPDTYTSGGWRRARASSDYNAEWFGVVGGLSTDQAPAIQAAINAVAGKGRLLFPMGTFIVGIPLTLPTSGTSSLPLIISGQGGLTGGVNNNTTIYFQGGSGESLLNLTPGTSVTADNCSISNLCIRGVASASGQIGISSCDMRGLRLHNVVIYNLKYGIKVDTAKGYNYAYYSTIHSTSFSSCGYGIYWDGQFNNANFKDCKFRGCDYGIYLLGAEKGVVVENTYFEGNRVEAVRVTAMRCLIDNSYFENNVKDVHFFSIEGYNPYASLKISGCIFDIANATTHALAAYPISITNNSPIDAAKTATMPATLVTVDSSVFINMASYTTYLVSVPAGTAYMPKSVILIGNKYKYPNQMAFNFYYPDVTSRIADGHSNVWRIAPSLSPVLSDTGVATSTQENWGEGMLRYDYGNDLLQFLASTTVGWEDLN